MNRNNPLKNGIPVSPSMNPALEAENFQPQKRGNKRRILYISFITFCISIAISFIAKFLVLLINLITNLSFYGAFSTAHASPTGNTLGWFVVLVPVLGSILVGLMAYFGSQAIRGHGIPEAMEQILTNQSKIKPVITFLKPLSAAISIGTGGPFGSEGPIIATGGALGSTLGQIIKISHYERKILLAAGATAGMSAIFGCPLAAIFLAVELLLFELSTRSILPVSIACITGAAGHHLLFGQNPVFSMPDVPHASNFALLAYAVIGVLVGLLSVFVSKAVYWVEEGFEKLPIHWMWWPAIGGLVVGIIGYFFPHTLGVGYDNISNVLSGSMAIKALLVLGIFKFISWAVALGSGTSGGTLAPLLTIGGAMGALIGMGFEQYLHQTEIYLPLAALVGMAAMFAGASRALLTSIVFALETTMQSNALLPLMAACFASYLVSYFLMEHNIMTEKIARRGIRTPDTYEPDILEKYAAKDVLDDTLNTLNENTSVQEAQQWILSNQEHQTDYIIVINNAEEYIGTVNTLDLLNIHEDKQKNIQSLIKKGSAIIDENDVLKHAVEIMANNNTDVIMVESEEKNALVGILSYKNILNIYKYRADEYETKKPPLSIKRGMFKIIINGRKYTSVMNRKEK
ncbi:MAG: chloride channel protein [Bacteroidetes bacterium]|nr:chloride channel protein [Bacteroidota bacterium]